MRASGLAEIAKVLQTTPNYLLGFADNNDGFADEALGLLRDVKDQSVREILLKQIILNRGLPFEVKISTARPVDISRMNAETLDMELEKGYADMQAGRTKSAAQVFTDIRRDFIYEREPWKSRNTRVVPVDNYVIFYIPNKTILKDPEMPLDGAKGTKTE